MLLRSLHLPLFSYIVLCQFCDAQNVTVDDEADNSFAVTFEYSPPSRWSLESGNNDTLPVASQALLGTVHSCTWDPATDKDFPQLTVNFSGTAVNLFGVLQQNVLTAVDIAINGTNVTRFSQIQDNGSPFIYNISLYSNSSLPPGRHTLTVSPAAEDFSAIFVDYLTFTPVRINLINSLAQSAPSSTDVLTTLVPLVPFQSSPVTSFSEPDVPTSTLTFSAPEIAPTLTGSAVTIMDSVISPSPDITSTTSKSIASGSKSQSSSSQKQSTLPPTMMYIIIASSVGGAILFFLAVALCLICRARRGRRYKAVPYSNPNGGPLASPNTQEFGGAPVSATSTSPFFPPTLRLNTNNSAMTPSPTITLSSDFQNTPTLTSELEGVFRQLEELSLEVETLQARNSFISISASTASVFSESSEEGDITSPSPTPRVLPLQVRGNIDRLRNEVERLRRQSHNTLNGIKDTGSAVVTQEMLEMLQDLALLRAEVEDMLAEQMCDGIERLPSYRSTRNSPCPPPTEAPPPLPSTPSQTVEND